jgi:hypothetical protein
MEVTANFTGGNGLDETIARDGYDTGPWNRGSFVLKGHYFDLMANTLQNLQSPGQEGVLLTRRDDLEAIVWSSSVIATGIRLDPVTLRSEAPKKSKSRRSAVAKDHSHHCLSLADHEKIMQAMDEDISDDDLEGNDPDGMF